MQCGDAAPLLNIMGVYHKQDCEKEEGQDYHKQDSEVEEGQVENTAASPTDEVEKPPHHVGGVSPKKVFNNWQKQISEDLLPANLQGEKQKNSSLSFAGKQLEDHTDILNKQIDNAINAVMGEKKPTKFIDNVDDATGLIEEVKLEEEESNLVEFFEDPDQEPENGKKFVKANRRVYTLEKGLLRANRRVYNLPVEVKEKLVWQNPAKQIDFTQTSHGKLVNLTFPFTG